MPADGQLTIRSVSARLRAALEREAARRRMSMNRMVLSLLAECLGIADSAFTIEHRDLDELPGTWSKSEAARFDESLRAQRPVDSKLWR